MSRFDKTDGRHRERRISCSSRWILSTRFLIPYFMGDAPRSRTSASILSFSEKAERFLFVTSLIRRNLPLITHKDVYRH